MSTLGQIVDQERMVTLLRKTVLAAPRGIVRSRKKGWRKPANTICVTRPGPWGNPFKVAPGMPPEQAVAGFRLELRYESLAIELGLPVRSQRMRWIAEHIGELKGKNLACFCPLGKPCHRDVLLQAANWEGVCS